MNYIVKVRGIQGASGSATVFTSNIDVTAPDETEARRLAMVKARQRFFHLRDVSVMDVKEMHEAGQSVVLAEPERKIELQGTVLRRVLMPRKTA